MPKKEDNPQVQSVNKQQKYENPKTAAIVNLKNVPTTKNPYINSNLGARKNKPTPSYKMNSQDYL